jgi:antitoxin HicB
MNPLHYPVILEPADEGGFVVSFPDVPEAITQGDTREAALSNAVEALETALDFYIEDKRPLPQPSSPEGLDTLSPVSLAHSLNRHPQVRQNRAT